MTDQTANPGVTVVVPTLNRGRYLLDTVHDLLAQDHRPLEVLLVDQSDFIDPDLAALVRQHPDVISHHQVSFRGLPIARNFGWQMARHDDVIFVDDDIQCRPDYVSRYQVALARERNSIVGGGVDGESHPSSQRPGIYHRWLASPSIGFEATRREPVDHLKGCNFGTQRRTLVMSGGFDERLNVGAALHEETELMLRARAAGLSVIYDGTLRLTHLAAGGGGTRQSDIRRYVYGLSHNRSVMIRRHSRWFQWPIAVLYSLKLMLAYAVHYRDPRVLAQGAQGLIAGWGSGGLPPMCTDFRETASP